MVNFKILPVTAAIMVSFPLFAQEQKPIETQTLDKLVSNATAQASMELTSESKDDTLSVFAEAHNEAVKISEQNRDRKAAEDAVKARKDAIKQDKLDQAEKSDAAKPKPKPTKTKTNKPKTSKTSFIGQGINIPMPANQAQPPAAAAAYDALSEADVQQELERQAIEAHQLMAERRAAAIAERQNKRADIQSRISGAISQPRPDSPLPMPGFRSTAGSGSAAMLKANVLRVVPGRNEVISVSMVQPNRIATPFKSPQVVGILPPGLIVKPVGQSIYVQMPDNSEESVALFVTGEDESAPVISLILAPDAIPAQTAILQLETPEPGLKARNDEDHIEPETYQQKLVSYLRDGALGITPAGMTRASLPAIVGRRGALLIRPEVRYSGATLDFWRYRVESISDRQIELDEAAFWEKGVRAVSIMPRLRLNRGEHTTVFVISDKSVFSDVAGGVR